MLLPILRVLKRVSKKRAGSFMFIEKVHGTSGSVPSDVLAIGLDCTGSSAMFVEHIGTYIGKLFFFELLCFLLV